MAPGEVAAQLSPGPAEMARRKRVFPPAAPVVRGVTGRRGPQPPEQRGPLEPSADAPPRKHAPYALARFWKACPLLAQLRSLSLALRHPSCPPTLGAAGPPGAAMKRTREEVDATLQIAKLNAAELQPAVHCLAFGPGAGAGAGDFCLLELEPALCQQLEAGHR